MSSDVEVANVALTLLGSARIASFDDNIKAAREISAIYETVRDATLAGQNWNFAKARAELPALVDPPVGNQFSAQYQLPTDCLRVVMVGDRYVGADLTDYRGSPTEEYAIEGRKILTDWSAPLLVKYISRVTDPNLFDPLFKKAFGCKLAEDLCEALSQSDTKRQRAMDTYRQTVAEAIRVNAIALPPQKLADDEWLMSRL